MLKRLLFLSAVTVLISSCGGKKEEVQKDDEKKDTIACNAPARFGKIDPASLAIEALPQPTYPKGSPVDQWGKLKVAENENGVRTLCDENGKPVQLRGVSSHGLQWSGVANLTAANIKTLKEVMKCSIFRIALYVDEEGGYAYNPSLRSRTAPINNGTDWGQVENVVRWCGENGIYCLIDWHVHHPGNPQDGKYRNRKYPESVEGIDLAADFFTYCAHRFQNQKQVIYEVCNEPNGKDENGNDVNWKDYVKPYCEDMLKIIRSYDKDAIVICGSADWSKNLEDIVGNEPQDENGKKYENVMYTYHFYAASHNDGKDGGPNYMERFSKVAAQLPIFVTEWGTTHSSGWSDFRPDLSNRWLELLNGNNEGKQVISWVNWSFSAEGGLSAMLKWNSGNIAPDMPGILTESGKFVYEKLKSVKN